MGLTLPAVLIDSNQLELALLNLVANARDAIAESGRIVLAAREDAVHVGHRTSLPSGRYVCLSVIDTGTGMDAGTLARATEPFFTTKGVGKGTGLGLSMVHGLAEQSGGRLVLRSAPGQGTTVELWLPVAPRPATAATTQQVTPAPSLASIGAPSTILVVDDDPLIAMTLSALLDDLGHRVVEAHSAQEALRLMAGREDIDAVITDYAMPHMNGLDLVQQLRKRHPLLPIVLASGYAELPSGAPEDIVRLAKPFTRNDLRAVIERITDTSVANGAARHEW